MRSYRASGRLKLALLALSLAVVLAVPSRHAMGADALGEVASKAVCGPNDHVESGLQGETTLAERFKSGPSVSYNCNLELVGHFNGEGAGWHMAEFENCAYYATPSNPEQKHRGVVVVDASDPQHPKLGAYLDSAPMLNANEFLEVSNTRKLLFANNWESGVMGFYDLSADCRHPVQKATLQIPGYNEHGGNFTGDGRTFYGANLPSYNLKRVDQTGVIAIDTSDPSKPHEIARWAYADSGWVPHTVTISEDGNRAYFALIGASGGPNGLVILDTSDVQARKPNPQIRTISTLFWTDAGQGQFATPVMIKGHPYLIYTDISTGLDASLKARTPAESCAAGLPPNGFARFIDISDEKNPKTVSKLWLEANDPANCATVVKEPVLSNYGYATSYCSTDNDKDGKLLACGYMEAGLRVFDIRDPLKPREIAYYKPPARRTEQRPGAFYFPAGHFGDGGLKDHTADAVMFPRFKKNATEIWFVSFDNDFEIVKFSDRLKAAEKDLFSKN